MYAFPLLGNIFLEASDCTKFDLLFLVFFYDHVVSLFELSMIFYRYRQILMSLLFF